LKSRNCILNQGRCGEKENKKVFPAKGSRFMDLFKNALGLFVDTGFSSQYKGNGAANLQIRRG
jgi:hypothetical protein